MDYKGLTIKFSGDASELLATLKRIDTETTATQTSLSRVSAALKLDPTSVALYEAQTRRLNSALDEEKLSLKDLKAKHHELSEKIAKAKRKLEELERAGKKNTEEYRNLKGACEEWEEELKDVNEEIAISEAKVKGYNTALETVSRNKFFNTTEWGKSAQSLDKFGQSLARVGGYLTNVLGLRLTLLESALVMGFGRSVLDEVEDYTNAISRVGGYLDITGSKLEEMSDLALYWGKETQFSATEAADAMSELAKGGMTQAQIAGGALEATMQLAAAGGIDMATAAGVAVNAIKVFGLNAEDATDVADALAGAANKSTAEISDLSSAFRYVSGWAGLADYSINDVAGALGLLADYGLTGQMAGTGLRNVIQRLAAPTGKAKELLDAYGVEVYDSSGKVKDLTSLVGELSDAFSDLDEETRNNVLNTIFGARGLPAAVALMEAGQDELEGYIESTKREGYALEMMQARMGDIGWALEYLRGEYETFKVSIGKALEPQIIEVANAIEDMLEGFNSWSAERQRTFVNTVMKILAAAPAAYALGTLFKILGGTVSGLARGMSFFGMLRESVKDGKKLSDAFGIAFETMTKGSVEAKEALTLLKTTFGLVGVAVVAFIGYKLWKEFERDSKRAKNLNTVVERTNKLLGDAGPSAHKMADSLFEVGDAATGVAKDVDTLLEDMVDFYQKVEETFRDTEINTGRLNKAWEIISRLGGREDLDETQLQELAGALSYVNEVLGTSYALHSDTAGIIYDENDEVVNLTESIWKLIEAKKAEIRMNAYGSLLEDAYKQQADALETLKQARADYYRIVTGRKNGETGWEYSQFALERARADMHDARVAADEAGLSVEHLEEEYSDMALEAQRASEAAQNGVADLGESIEGFPEAFKEAGLHISDFVGLTDREFSSMLESADGDMQKLLDLLQEWLDKQPIEGEVQFTASNPEKIKSDVEGLRKALALQIEPIKPEIDLDVDTDGNGTLMDVLDAANGLASLRMPHKRGSLTIGGNMLEFVNKVIPDWKKLNIGSKSATANVSGNLHQATNDLKEWNRLGMESKWGKATIAVAIQSKGVKSGGLADGGMLYRHADGYITNHSIYSGSHVIGEAGIEAVLPLNNRAATQPLVDAIADGVSRRVGGGNQYNLYINDARVNDDQAIRAAFINLMGTVQRKGAMNVGR